MRRFINWIKKVFKKEKNTTNLTTDSHWDEIDDKTTEKIAEELMKDGHSNTVEFPRQDLSEEYIKISEEIIKKGKSTKYKRYIADDMTPVVFTSMDDVVYSGFYIDAHIDRSTVPYLGETAFVYECRHNSDGDWVTPVTIEDYVVINFAGTFVTNLPIAFPDKEVPYILIKDISYD